MRADTPIAFHHISARDLGEISARSRRYLAQTRLDEAEHSLVAARERAERRAARALALAIQLNRAKRRQKEQEGASLRDEKLMKRAEELWAENGELVARAEAAEARAVCWCGVTSDGHVPPRGLSADISAVSRRISRRYLGGYLGGISAVSRSAVSRRISRRYLGGVSQARADSLAFENTKLSEAIAAEDAEMGRMKSELKTSLMWTRARAKSMAEKAKLMLGARS